MGRFVFWVCELTNDRKWNWLYTADADPFKHNLKMFKTKQENKKFLGVGFPRLDY